MEEDFSIGLAPNKADRESAAQFSACRLVSDTTVESGFDHKIQEDGIKSSHALIV
jgi:hypothetical protein